MEQDKLTNGLRRLCADRFGNGELSGLNRLSGGANMESWSFDFSGRPMVLRRMPSGIDPADRKAIVTSISLAAQADLISQAASNGVTAPRVLAVLNESDSIGTGFIMERAIGETLPHKILGNPDYANAEAHLSQQCSAELAAIHQMPMADLPGEVRSRQAAELLAEQELIYRDSGAEIPAFEWAFCELERSLPTPVEPRLIHGDFRMGNLMIDPSGITAVLDWELAHLGDPAEDLAYLCTPSWRFGHYEKEAGGFASADNLIAEYEQASGSAVDRSRFNWWLLFNTVWWGITCLRMGSSWRDASVRTVERTIIGRRVSEVEIDLLIQLGENHSPLDWRTPPLLSETGEVTYWEVLGAIGEWASSLVDEAHGHAKFQARVSRNAAGMAQRYAAWSVIFERSHAERLAAINTSKSDLCKALRSGAADPNSTGIWDHLRITALERLAIDQPNYAGLRVAKNLWSIS